MEKGKFERSRKRLELSLAGLIVIILIFYLVATTVLSQGVLGPYEGKTVLAAYTLIFSISCLLGIVFLARKGVDRLFDLFHGGEG